jgi:DNA-binding transcriptional ArsR family regulator
MNANPEIRQVAAALAALGHEARLSVFRLLVRAGNEGLNVGQIGGELDLPASTLAHHLRALVLAGLVIQERHGREVINRPDFDAMNAMTDFLSRECCTGLRSRTDAA